MNRAYRGRAERLEDLGEDRIIESLSKRFNTAGGRVLKGIGDDASVTLQKGGSCLLATTDILIEGTHFKMDRTTPVLLGKKSLNISISDVAAMGGVPLFFLVSIALPPRTTKEFLDGLYKGISGSAKRYGLSLVGGNTARADRMMVSTTVFGEAEKERIVFRSGATPGDVLYVTGTLGDSALGLKTLDEAGGRGGRAIKGGPFKKAVMRHLAPEPRLEAGRTLALKGLASSMIDVSDGLLLDLKRLAHASKVGAEVLLPNIPLSMEFKSYLSKRPSAIGLALSGGEDYELLFTAPSGREKEIAALSKEIRLPITAIGGVVSREKGISVVDGRGRGRGGGRGKRVKVSRLGFEHF